MGRQCCVLGCSSGVNLPFHTFPKDLSMARQWKKAIYSEKIQHLTDEQIRKCIVCYRHFAESDYVALYRLRRLKPGVIPSLYLPNNTNKNIVIKEEIKTNLVVEKSKMETPCISTATVSEEETKMIVNKQSMPEISEITNAVANDSQQLESSSLKHSIKYLYDKHTKYFHHFTPKMWKLYRIACVLKKKQEAIAKRQLSFRQRIRQAKQYSKSPAVEKLLCSLTPAQQTFIQMQIKESKQPSKDRRYTLDEKVAALSIMKQSNKCYQYLTQVFDLPSMHTLCSILQKVNIHPGPINFINQRLKEQVRLMKQKDKVCLLMWDEMLLQPHLDYDTKKKRIIGFEDFGNRRTARFADHALVFMVRGVQNGWKFPLAYYFCDGMTKTDQLIEWIRAIAKIIINSGLHLVAFICDNKKRNLAAIDKLKLESAMQRLKRGEPYYGNITIKGRAIIPLYDPPYLIKKIRDNLLTHDLEFDYAKGEERKFASWQIIEQAYHMDLTHSVCRLMPKITTEHVINSEINKKKVKNATQILSMTMGGFIHHHTQLEGPVNTIYGPLKMPEKSGQDTAEIILFFDRLFDSVNGHTLKPEKELRVAVSNDSPHLPFWEEAIKRLCKMRFVDPKDKSSLKGLTILDNWISTVKGFRKLWKVLKTYEFKYFKPRILNQDSLTHFFAQIRSLGNGNVNPTCAEFESSFKTLLLNNLTSRCTIRGNNENKIDGPLLFTLKEFICCRAKPMNNNNLAEELQLLDLEAETKSSDATQDCINICSSIAVKMLNHSRIKECRICKDLLMDPAQSDLIASASLLKAFQDADNIMTKKISSVCYLHHTALMLETELYALTDLSWLNCQQHRIVLKEILIPYIVVFYISKWCNGINKILTGKEHDS